VPVYPWEHPLGARALGDGTVAFRVWAPHAERPPHLELDGAEHELEAEGHDVFAAVLPAAHGARYRFVADGTPLPDPCTRWQPDGLRGASAVVDPQALAHEHPRVTVDLADLVLYELHVGTFSAAGTFDGAIEHLPALAELGVTAIELMPVAQFPGRFGWGYDGVYPGAAQDSYGGPEGLARLVDAAHGLGLAVLLDVVHNHVGASGEQALRAFGPYFTDRYSTFWGQAINFDDRGSGPVREWICQSAEWWVRDLRLDGLRLDAIHAIFDASAEHLVAEVARRVHAVDHRALVIAESGLNDPKVVTPSAHGGWGCDAAWADDLHHAIRTVLTGEREGYYAEFGRVADIALCLREPHFHHGQFSAERGRRFGAPARDLPPEHFVVFTQNHDQVGNRAFGDRPSREVQPLAALLVLLSRYTPMLFMGEEHGEPAPFQFFADHIDEEIAIATRDGRRREFAGFASFSTDDVPDPLDPATFERSKLTRDIDPAMRTLYRELLALRRELVHEGVGEVRFDEEARWLRFTRGSTEVVANLAAAPQELDVPADARVRLAAGEAHVAGGRLRLGARSGAALDLVPAVQA
jgi:maltooligosyltrehalose trehalohydrolase